MKIVGVTGPSGAGKSSFTEYFKDRDIPVINADEVYHSLLIPPSSCLDAIRDAFGDSVIGQNGELDRKVLSSIVFNDKSKLDLLNSTVLHFVLDKINLMIAEHEADNEMIIIDAPTLIESGFHEKCDTVVSILCPSEIRINRIVSRDSIDVGKAIERTKAQKSDDFYIQYSDYVIVNNGDKNYFEEKIRNVAERMGVDDSKFN